MNFRLKKRIILTAFIALVIFAVTILSACNVTAKMINELDKIPTNGDYTFVSSYGVTHKGKDYEFEKLINSALKSNGEKAYNQGHIAIEAYNGGKLYFSYNYYNKTLTDDYRGDALRKFCAGYVDINDLSVHFFGFYKHTKPYFSIGLIGYQAGKFLILIHCEGFVEIYDTSTAEKSGEISAQYLKDCQFDYKKSKSDCDEIAFYQSETGEMLFIDGEGAFTEVLIDFGESGIKTFYGFTKDYLLFCSSSSININEAYDRQTYSRTDKKTAITMREQIDNYDNSPKVEYAGESYTYSVTDEEIIFKSQSGEEMTVTMSTLRESSKELRKVEEICGGELWFRQVKAANGELYLIAQNDESFFGTVLFSHMTPPIVFKYDMNGTFEYIGRASGASVVTIIKN